MATGTPNLDINPCLGTDVLAWGDERATSGSDSPFVLNINANILQIGGGNVLNFRSVDDPNSSENLSRVESGDGGGPVLREHWKPRGLLRVGRSRLGFPDSDKDHLVQLLVCKNQYTREVLDIAGHYDLTVTVSYEGASGSLLHLPDYQCRRIKSKTKNGTNASMIGVIGYLFRFHEPGTKYKITFCLNAIPSKGRGQKRTLKEHTACETICQISVTLETGPMTSSKSDKTKKKVKDSTAQVSSLIALSPPSLSKECTVLYKRSWWVVNQLRSRRANAKWEDFEKLASNLLLKFTDSDTRIAIKLEQGINASYQNQPDRALQLIDEAFSFMCEAKNPQLMASRGYFYQAEILREQGSLGQAENCLNLAGQNIAACQTNPDTRLVDYGRASMLMTFIGCTPHRSLQQVKVAQSILEKCIDVCLHVESDAVETESSYLYAMKQLFIIVLHKMATLLLDCDSETARKRIASKECIAKAQWCLHTMRDKYWSDVTQGDITLFYLGSSDLEYRRSNYADAEEFARLAKDKAVEMGFKLEALKAQERLDFMRAMTRGDTINNGPQQSESDHEGENADISSSEAESDWLTELLN